MSEILLQLIDIEKNFGETEVLNKINFEVLKGEFVTLLGPSGCGKTTTLRIIAGLESPDLGKVILSGTDITRLEPNKRNVNIVFQNYALFPHMTVEANIGYGLKLRKIPKSEIKKQVDEVLSLVMLEGLGSRMPNELSGGQKQRVAIARAIINKPQILLLDEPLGALDLQLRRQMQTELKRLQKQLGISFVYITHDQEEALSMSDRIGVMKEGNIIQIGTPSEIYDLPLTSYVAKFVGDGNIIGIGTDTIAVRSENIILSGDKPTETENALCATVHDKNFVGGMLKISAVLDDGTSVTASRQGIGCDFSAGQRVWVSWKPEHGVAVRED